MKNKIKKVYNLLGNHYYISRKKKSGSSYFFNELLEMPTTLKLIDNVKNKKILDVGCGPGIYSRILSDKGAKVKGIDISKELIKIAKIECPEGEFVIGDAHKLPYKNFEFDIVIATLILDHISNWNPIFKEVRRVLKRKGIFIFSSYNPITESMIGKKWFFRKFKIVQNYFNEGWWGSKWSGPRKSEDIVHHHKTYETIIKTIIKNKFEIIGYADSYPLSKDKDLFKKHYKEALNFPKFCTWKLQKK